MTDSQLNESDTSLEVGAVIRLDDVETGFDDNKLGRPYLVVGKQGDPPHTYVLSPRTTSGRLGVAVPASAMRCFNRDGRFVWRAFSAPAEVVERTKYEGQLPQPYLGLVLQDVNTIEYDLD